MKELFKFGEFYGKTQTQFDTASFIFVEVEDFNNGDVPTHTHETAHFCFIIKGEYESTVKDKLLPCSTLTMLYHPAGTTHRDHFYSEGGQFLTISLNPKANKTLLDEIKMFDCSVKFNDGEISWLGKRICKELNCLDNLSPIVLEGMANELLVYATRSSEKSNKPPNWLEKAYGLINDRCNEKITIAEIASTVGVHPLHLARTFRVFFNCSPGEYLRKCRTDFASNLLLNSNKTLAEIALMSGFSDQSQFTQSFKQAVGTTPKKFRTFHNS